MPPSGRRRFFGPSDTGGSTSSTAGGTQKGGETVERTERDRERLAIVEEYANRVLEVGRDRWSGEDTPLLADGVHVDTHDPVTWQYDDREWIVHNLASQQNLFRVLTGLSNLTDESTYERAAKDAIAYHFDRLVDESGLLRWGGHQFVDLRTLEPVGEFDADTHEFKTHFPYYDLFWEVDEAATARFLRGVWNAHVLDWSRLDMNRHGDYGQTIESDDPWDRPWDDPAPFYEGRGLSFINIGTDLIWAAGTLAELADEEDAWTWGCRLVEMYVKARHPDTGLGTYQYTKPRQREAPPAEGSLAKYTSSKHGDRAENQFGDQFGDVAREGWVLWGNRVKTIYVSNALVQLELAERLGAAGTELREWTANGLAALAEHAYDPEENVFRPMWADGTDLTGKTYDRTGYYGEKGTPWKPLDADVEFLFSYARGYRLTGRETLWKTARRIADGLGIGDIGTPSGEEVALEPDAPGASPEEVFALVELHRAAPHPDYVDRARQVVDRMIEQRYHHGFFLPSERHVYARFDAIEPLAIVTLDATLRGEPEQVPAYMAGSGNIHGWYDGHGRAYDRDVIWSVTRDER